MRILLPYSDITDSATYMHRRDLGKQVIHIRRVLDAIEGKSKGWQKHPEVIKWKPHKAALQFILRKYNRQFKQWAKCTMDTPNIDPIKFPDWVYNDSERKRDRITLYNKRPRAYKRFGWGPTIKMLSSKSKR
jgi:hypothetical protein